MKRQRYSRRFIVVYVVLAVLVLGAGIALYFLRPISAAVPIQPDCKGQTPCNSAYCTIPGVSGTNTWANRSGWVPRDVPADVANRYQGFVTKVFDLYITMMPGYVTEIISARNDSNPSNPTVFLPNSTLKFAYEIKNPSSTVFSFVTVVSFQELNTSRSVGKLSYGTTSINPRQTWSSTKTLNLPPDLNTSGIKVTVTHSRVPIPSRGEAYCIASVKNVMILSTKPSAATPTVTATATRTATATATATATRTTTATATATATTTATAQADTYTFPKGYSVFVVPSTNQKLATKLLTDAGLTLFEFNRTGNRQWRRVNPNATSSLIPAFFPKVGYYIYNPGVSKKIKMPKSATQEQIDVRRGWNLLGNPENKNLKLSQITLNVLKPDAAVDCSDVSSCSQKKTIKDLLQGTAATRRAYNYIYVIVDDTTTNASKAFRVLNVSSSNMNSVEIPAKKAYWLYLWE